MQVIRSILWIGSEQGLIQNGLLNADRLDVIWSRDVEAALGVPLTSFEAAVVALDAPESVPDAIAKLMQRRGMPPLLVLAPATAASELPR